MINLQKGQSVYIVPIDKRYEPFYTKVLSIGSKYITVDMNKNENKFFIQHLRHIDDRYKLYLSKKHYEKEIKTREKRKEIIDNMSSIYLVGLDYTRLCELDTLIRMYIFNGK